MPTSSLNQPKCIRKNTTTTTDMTATTHTNTHTTHTTHMETSLSLSQSLLLKLYQLLQQQGQVEVRRYKDSDITQKEVCSTDMSVDTLSRMIVSGDAKRQDLYLANFDLNSVKNERDNKYHENIQQICRRLCNMDKIENILGLNRSEEPLSIWFGPGGHREQLHYDTFDNVHVCLVGQKKWRLFPPTLRNFRACQPLSICHNGSSDVSVNFAGRSADECLRHGATGELVFTLQPGDAIWVPALWWHEVSGKESLRSTDSTCRCGERSANDYDHPGSELNNDDSNNDVDIDDNTEDAGEYLQQVLHMSVLSVNQFRKSDRVISQSAIALWQRLRIYLYDRLSPHPVLS